VKRPQAGICVRSSCGPWHLRKIARPWP